MTVNAALSLDERARWVLLAYHISGCGDCPASEDETLAQLAAGYRVDLGRLLADLNSLEVRAEAAPADQPTPI